MYDIIGDIHGFAQPLRALLAKLGYQESDGVYRHPSRQVIFLGDFIDRGKQNREVVSIARRMAESGSALAVMGNHEFNAIAYATPDPDRPGEFLRPHNPKNDSQHKEFLAEYANDPVGYRDCIDWFMTLPLFLDLPGLRVIHACWYSPVIDELSQSLGANSTLTPELLIAASRKGEPEYEAIELLLKGPEVSLPPGRSFSDKDKNPRTEVRVKWWLDPEKSSFHELVVGPPKAIDAARDAALPDWLVTPYPADAPPVMIGHYWMNGHPSPLAHNVACLDYSVAKGGELVAYRWDGEAILSAEKMVRVQNPMLGAMA
ncbi:MAG: metallophosphoesterase [Oceanococcus sp.]